MQPELDGLFNDHAQELPPGVSAELRTVIKRAYMAGALAVLTRLPRNELVHTRAEIDRLTPQAQAYLQNVPMPAAVAQDSPVFERHYKSLAPAPATPAATDAPAATSDSPHSDLPVTA